MLEGYERAHPNLRNFEIWIFVILPTPRRASVINGFIWTPGVERELVGGGLGSWDWQEETSP